MLDPRDRARCCSQHAPGISARRFSERSIWASWKEAKWHYPRIRFRIISEQDRIRCHIRIFVNLEEVSSLAAPLRVSDEVMIVGALSGG